LDFFNVTVLLYCMHCDIWEISQIATFYIVFKNLCISPEDDRYRSKHLALKLKIVLRRSSSYLSAAYRVLGFRIPIRQKHGYLSFVSVVFYQVEVSASGWSLVQRSPTERGVSRCGRKASTLRSPWSTRGCCAKGRRVFVFI
jgi:hypothetical protein